MTMTSAYLTIPEAHTRIPSSPERRRNSAVNWTEFAAKNRTDAVRDIVSEDETSAASPSASANLKPTLNQWCRLVTAISTGSMAACSPLTDRKEVDFEGQAFIKRYSAYSVSFPQHLQEKYEDLYRRGSRGSALVKVNQRCKFIRGVLNHDSSILFYWLSFLAISIFYNWWSMIVREAFPLLQSRYTAWWALGDAFADLCFVADIIVQLRTGYLQEGMLVISTQKLVRHYIFSVNFVVDLVSLLPLEYVYLAVSGTFHPICRFTRLFKSYRVGTLYYKTETRTVFPNLNRVATLTHILILSCHWLACIYHMIVVDYKNFVDVDPDQVDIVEQYLYSLYWSTLTLTTIGNNTLPKTKWEYVFSIISYLFGVFVFATIVGQVGNVINNRNASRLQFERLLDGAKHYMRNHRVPKEMHTRVLRWYDYAWSRGRMTGGTDIESLSVLPEKLKMELALHVNISTLKKVSIFGDCEPEFLRELVLKMRAMIFTPGDFVCRKGEIAREMYIIADGVLHVLNEMGDKIAEMRSGEVFGEIGVLNLDANYCRRTADVRSVGYSEMFCLSRDDIMESMHEYPRAEMCLRSHGEKRLASHPHSGLNAPIVTVSDSGSIIDDDSETQNVRAAERSNATDRRQSFQSSTSRSLDIEMMRTDHNNSAHVNHRSLSVRKSFDDRMRRSSLAKEIRRSFRKPAPSPVTNLLGCRITNSNSNDISDLYEDTDRLADTSPPVHRHSLPQGKMQQQTELEDIYSRLRFLVDHNYHKELESEIELINETFVKSEEQHMQKHKMSTQSHKSSAAELEHKKLRKTTESNNSNDCNHLGVKAKEVVYHIV